MFVQKSGNIRVRRAIAMLALAAVAGAGMPRTAGASAHVLVPANVSIDEPAPLFSNGMVSGVLTLDDVIAPGATFRLSNIAFVVDCGGIVVSSAETMVLGGDIAGFGTRSADGLSISFLDIRYDLPVTVPSRGFDCSIPNAFAAVARGKAIRQNRPSRQTGVAWIPFAVSTRGMNDPRTPGTE